MGWSMGSKMGNNPQQQLARLPTLATVKWAKSHNSDWRH